MDEKTALEELQFIRKVIEDSKRSVIDNGLDYIFWGVIVTIGLLATYILIVAQLHFNYFWIWAGLAAIGWVFSGYRAKKYRERLPKTFAGKIIGIVWAATGVTMTILGFIAPLAKAFHPVFISPVLAAVLGAAYLITGTVMEVKWIALLSIGWWAGAVIMLLFPVVHSILLMALMMIALQTIPGIILFRKYKKETILDPNE